MYPVTNDEVKKLIQVQSSELGLWTLDRGLVKRGIEADNLAFNLEKA
jgi:hypothetical protein